jgi:hypothetical protein
MLFSSDFLFISILITCSMFEYGCRHRILFANILFLYVYQLYNIQLSMLAHERAFFQDLASFIWFSESLGFN